MKHVLIYLLFIFKFLEGRRERRARSRNKHSTVRSEITCHRGDDSELRSDAPTISNPLRKGNIFSFSSFFCIFPISFCKIKTLCPFFGFHSLFSVFISKFVSWYFELKSWVWSPGMNYYFFFLE